jgi:ABC-type multidrug transport system fused ATPase/permease subunit
VTHITQQFNRGHRQLLCVARALLREPTVLVLDEAIASLDKASATILQETIYDASHGTMINIAHHLDFVRDAQKVLCLNAGGTIADFDTHEALSANPKSLFSSLERAEAH